MLIKRNRQRHPFHLVDPSPWPFIGSFGAFALTFGGVMYMHSYSGGWTLFVTGFLSILFVMYITYMRLYMGETAASFAACNFQLLAYGTGD